MKTKCGKGTEEDPYVISNPSDLYLLNDRNDSHFVLSNDIDACDIDDFRVDKFTGVLNGQGHAIKNINIMRLLRSSVGFVSECEGTIKNLVLQGCDVEGEEKVGGLVGENKGKVLNCWVMGKVKGESDVAMIAGENKGLVKNCLSNGVVKGKEKVSGLVGSNEERVKGCCSRANVKSTSDYSVFPDISYDINSCEESIYIEQEEYVNNIDYKNINRKNSYQSNIDNDSEDKIISGGITSVNSGVVEECSFSGSITGNTEISGGVVGCNKGEVTLCSFTGNIRSFSKTVGGLVGENDSVLVDSYSGGQVEIKGENVKQEIGALVGKSDSFFSSISFISGNSDSETVIKNCYWVSGSCETSKPVGSNWSEKIEKVDCKETLKEARKSIIVGRI